MLVFIFALKYERTMSSLITLYDYMPASVGELPAGQERIRHDIIEFKEGACPEHVMRDISAAVKKAMEQDPGNCTICFVPASRLDLTVSRYTELASYLASEFPDKVYMNTIELCDSYDEILEESRKFVCNRDRVKGRTVIFIDDIYNTGRAYAEIVSLLEENGAKDEIGVYIARVVRR